MMRRWKKDSTKRTTVDFSFISWNPLGGLKSLDVTSTVTLGRAVPWEKCWSCAFSMHSSSISYNVLSVFSFRSLRERETFSLNATNVNTITTLCRSCHVCIVVSYLLHHRQRAFFQKGNFSALLSPIIYSRTHLEILMSRKSMCAYLIIVAKLYIIHVIITKSTQELF